MKNMYPINLNILSETIFIISFPVIIQLFADPSLICTPVNIEQMKPFRDFLKGTVEWDCFWTSSNLSIINQDMLSFGEFSTKTKKKI